MSDETTEPHVPSPASAAGAPGAATSTMDFALWLTPRGAQRTAWRKRIEAIAKLLDGPVFAPHVTLFGSFRRPLAEALVLAEALSRDLAPIPLRGGGLGCRPDRWQALFVPLVMTPELWRARCTVCDALAAGGPVDYFPHLSLYYGDLTTENKGAALALLDPLPEIDERAGELVLVSLGDSPERWSTEAILPLRG